MWEGETVVRRCDSSQGGVKVVRNLFQLMGRYDGRGEDVRVCGKMSWKFLEIPGSIFLQDNSPSNPPIKGHQ